MSKYYLILVKGNLILLKKEKKVLSYTSYILHPSHFPSWVFALTSDERNFSFL